MNLWNKITIGTKFLFGRWASALDDILQYLLDYLNGYLGQEGVANKIKDLHDTVSWTLDWLVKISVKVPQNWRNEYMAICDVVADLLTVSEDGKLTAEEVKALAASFAEAKAKWDED